MVTQTINDLFFVVNVRDIQIPISSLIKGGLAGLLASILAAAPPAWEAASVPPRLALSRAGLESKAITAVNLSALLGILASIIGGLILRIPTRDLVISFSGTFAVLIGMAALTPFVTVSLMRLFNEPLATMFGLIGRLAPRNVIRSQSRTAIAVAALMIAVSVTIGVQVMIASFRTTISLWLDQTLVGDIYISAQGISATRLDTPLDPEVVGILLSNQNAQSSAVVRVVSVEGESGSMDVVAVTTDRLDPRILLKGNPDTVVGEVKNGSILLSEPLAARLGITTAGGIFSLLTPAGWKAFPVAGIYTDYASTRGTIRMDIDV